MLKRPEDIARFANDGAPGSWESYGRGEHPPRDLVRAMRPYVDAGVLVPSAKREDGGFLYLVTRSRAGSGTGTNAAGRRLAKRAAPRGAGHPAQSDQTKVFQCLVRAACRGLPCPSYCEIARRCSLNRERARWWVRRLVSKGRIAAQYDPHSGWRVITITAGPHAGKCTMAGHTMMAKEPS